MVTVYGKGKVMMKANKIHMIMILKNIDQGAEMDNMDNQFLIFMEMILIRAEEMMMMKVTMICPQWCTHL